VNGIVRAVAVLGAAVAAAGCAGMVVRPTTRLAPRVRPYSLVARARLRGDADVLAVTAPVPNGVGVTRVLGPPVVAVVATLGRLFDRRDDAELAVSLRQAGRTATPADQRHATALAVTRDAAVGATVGALALRSALAALGLAVVGAVAGGSRVRARLDRDVRDRAERMRLELYTVNQLLAMHVRAGAGPIQAVQRLVDRGSGAVADELAAVLLAVRRGVSEPQAFRDAAASTPEPAAARTYKLFAAGAERGVDLAGGLRALSEDLRDARREEVRQTATKRRAAMLVPTIAVLAPVMLLFIAAPLPSVVFGAR
jgi:Flp pilus assembly protein TadB